MKIVSSSLLGLILPQILMLPLSGFPNPVVILDLCLHLSFTTPHMCFNFGLYSTSINSQIVLQVSTHSCSKINSCSFRNQYFYKITTNTSNNKMFIMFGKLKGKVKQETIVYFILWHKVKLLNWSYAILNIYSTYFYIR